MAIALQILGGAHVDDVPTVRQAFARVIRELPKDEQGFVTAFADACMTASPHADRWQLLEAHGEARTQLLELLEGELERSSPLLEVARVAMLPELSSSDRVDRVLRSVRDAVRPRVEPLEPPYESPPPSLESTLSMPVASVGLVVLMYWMFCVVFLAGSVLFWRWGLAGGAS